MKKILVAAALIGTGVSAQAADLPAKAKYYKAPVAVAYNWTGFYFGVNAGVGFGRSFTQLSSLGRDPMSNFGGVGGVGGGQIGYNWQYGNLLGFGNIVLGLEADLQGAGLRDNRTCEMLCTGVTGFGVNQKLDWFGTARARVGIATGPVLSYVTGGFAYGGVKTAFTDFVGPTTTSFSQTRTGYTLGSGVEAALGGNWTGKVEYLYVDLGTQNGAVLAPTPYNFRSEVREHIFRVGLNYRMGGAGVYMPEPVANWSGWYLGGNGGGATALNKSSLTAPAAVAEAFNLSPNGYLGGAQIGYNWQAAAWVFGFEGDFDGGSVKDNKACELTCVVGSTAAFNQKMNWLGTARGRVGYSVGSTLFYATGGFAAGGVKTNVTGAFGGVAFNQSFSHSKSGYTVGGGIESPFDLFGWFGRNWTSKTEYLYVDLGRSTDAIAGTALTFSTRSQEHILRTGLNYHFNSPVVARY